jgi:ABC-2 type transport system permease protein
MYSIFKKEVGTFFNGLIGYIVIGFFLLLSGLMVWVYPGSNVLDYGYAELTVFFDFCPYLFLFLIPAVTMRMFSEEFRTGTIELLFTKPISLSAIILGKFLASLFIIFLALLLTVVYYCSIYYLGNPIGNIDSAAVIGSYLGLLFLASAYVSIGILSSSFTKNQVVAFIIGAVLCYFFYDGLFQLSAVFRGNIAYFLSNFSLSFHFNSLQKGLLDTRNIIFFISFTWIFLWFCLMVLKRSRN